MSESISFSQRITTIAGGIGNGRPAVQAQLNGPSGVVIDNQGNVFFADTQNSVVRKIDFTTGVVTTIAGNGEFGSDGDGGFAVNAQLFSPAGLELDGVNNLYISDQGVNRIRKVDLTTGLISTIAGIEGAPGFSGDGGLAINARLSGSRNVCLDGAGNIYICDVTNHRIRKIDHASGLISTVAGTGVQGFSGDNGLAISAQLNYPTDVTIDSDGNLLIADRENQRLRKVNLSSNIISTIAGIGTPGFSGDNGLATGAQLNWPLGITIDQYGDIYFSDANNGRIRRINKQTGIISSVIGNGTQGFSGDAGPAVDAQLASPQGLAIDGTGRIYIADYLNNRIRKVATGNISTIAGNGGFFGDGGLALNASLRNQQGIAFDSNDNLIVADVLNNRLRKIDHSSGIITTIAGTGEMGFSGDGGQAINAKIFWPKRLVLDASDNIYFTDSQNSRIRRIDSSTGLITTFAGNGNIGFNGDNLQPTGTSLNGPDGIALDSNGDIYFSDTYNQRVRKISVSTNLITTVAGVGTNGFSGDNGLGVNAQLSYPADLVINSGKLYIADKTNNRVRGLDLTTGIINTVAGGGFQQGENVLALDSDLGFPAGLTIDPLGNLVIASGKVRKVDKISSLVEILAGSGLQGFSGDNGPAPLARLSSSSAAFDSNGNLFISDAGNNCIRKVVQRSTQTVTFNPLSPVSLGDVPFSISISDAFSNVGLPITFSSSDVSIASVAGNTVTLVGAGTVTITATQIGNIDYLPSSAQQNLLVNKGNPTITITSRASGPNGGSIALTVNKGGSTGAVNYTVANGTGSATINGDVLSLTATGTVTVTATVAADNNYSQGATTQQVTIEKSMPVISMLLPSNGVVGTNVSLSINKGGSIGPVTYSIVGGTGTGSISTTSLMPTGAGTLLIKAVVDEDANYKAGETTSAITINSSSTAVSEIAQLWGLTTLGGIDNAGTIFRTNSDGGGLSVQHEFTTSPKGHSPFSELIQASNGKLYGIASGGLFNQGVLFEFDPLSLTYSKKFDFSNASGYNPLGSMVQAPNGKLYGTVSAGGVYGNGVLYEFNPQTSAFTKKMDFLHSVNGSSPQGELVVGANGKIYGTCPYGGAFNYGVLFEYDPGSNLLVNKIDFSPAQTGNLPNGNLLLSGNGKIYGLTSFGGQNAGGVLYSYDPTNNLFSKVHDFTNQESGGYLNGNLSEGTNGKIYGTSHNGGDYYGGFIFECNPATNAYVKKLDLTYGNGSSSNRMIANANGKFYGTTSSGGPNQGGVIFEYNPIDNSYSRKFDFYYITSGSSPSGPMTLASNGKFYGLTYAGGDHNKGVLYEYDAVSNTCLRRFNFSYAPNGAEPNGKLTVTADGRLFGTSRGGESDQGVLFEYDRLNNQFVKKLEFDEYQNGNYPTGSLLLTSTGKMFGMTTSGGNGSGVIYEYDPVNNNINKRFELNLSTTGGLPESSLMEASNGKLYGVASSGGVNSSGTLFEFDPVANQFAKRFDFESSTSGCFPKGALVEGLNHKLYGTASHCGAHNNGVFFEFDIVSNTFKKIIDFEASSTGNNPEGSLVLAPDGLLYGTTDFGGANNHGVLFSYNTSTNSFSKKVDFENQSTGYFPLGGLIVGAGGKLYATTRAGGSNGMGVLFEFDPSSSVITKRFDFSNTNGRFPTGYLTLVKVNQSISFSSLSDETFGNSPFDLTASTTSGLTLVFTSSNPNVATVSGKTVSIVGVGTTTITSHQPGDFDYTAATDVSHTLTVVKADQSITFNAPGNVTFTTAPLTLSASVTSGLTISYSSSDEAVATISGNTLTILKPGTSIITAKQSGNANYNAAPDVPKTVVVSKGDQAITFNPLLTKTVGDASFTLSATTTSGLPLVYSSSNQSVATISGNAVTIVGAGSTVITASQSGNVNYNCCGEC